MMRITIFGAGPCVPVPGFAVQNAAEADAGRAPGELRRDCGARARAVAVELGTPMTRRRAETLSMIK
ncbi:MAG: hypothetical protein HZY76_20545 [Anaerolineae bacterium]|nr:MAG: hypothetical protein HZY76_20545 [Anaerolineae bacterium]